MANYTLTPSPWQTFFYANGAPVAGGQLFTYLAGTTTPAPTYLNASGTPNTNPIILDAAGRAVIYLAGGSYRFDLYDSVANGGALIKTEDNITSVPVSATQPAVLGIAGTTILAGQVVYLSVGFGGLTPGRWYPAQANNDYSSIFPEVGFAQSDTSAGNAIAVIQTGQVTTGLSVTTGNGYFIDPTSAGSVTTIPPAFARLMGQADSASSLVVGNPPPAQTRVITSTVVGPQNNFDPGLSKFTTHTILYMSNPTTTTITGIVAGYNGQRLVIEAIGSAQVDFIFNSPLSSAGNKLGNFVQTGPTSIFKGGTVEYQYDAGAGFWRLISHEQGSWLSVPFAAVNFTGSGSMVWTVSAANLNGLSYRLSGKTLQAKWQISNTTVSGTVNNSLIIQAAAFGGYFAPGVYALAELQASIVDAGALASAYAQATFGAIVLVKVGGSGNWTLSAGATNVVGGLTFEVG